LPAKEKANARNALLASRAVSASLALAWHRCLAHQQVFLKKLL
jgi:hypothetical protein